MADSINVHALVNKRAEVAGLIADLEERTRQHRASLAHIDATLLLFDPNASPATIRAKSPVKGRSGYFGNGEITRRCREALRVATVPLAAESIARQAMSDKGLDAEDKALRQDMNRRFLWALHRLNVAAQVNKIGHGLGARWTLPTPT